MPLRLVLRGYSIASLPRASHSSSLRSLAFRAHENFQQKKCVSIDSKWSKTHRNTKKNFTPLTHYALRAEHSERQSATVSTPAIALLSRALRSLCSLGLRARILSRFVPSGFALALLGHFAPSGFGLCARYLPHDTPRVRRSVHAKFHHDRIKTMGARGIQTYIHIDSLSMTVALS